MIVLNYLIHLPLRSFDPSTSTERVMCHVQDFKRLHICACLWCICMHLVTVGKKFIKCTLSRDWGLSYNFYYIFIFFKRERERERVWWLQNVSVCAHVYWGIDSTNLHKNVCVDIHILIGMYVKSYKDCLVVKKFRWINLLKSSWMMVSYMWLISFSIKDKR